MVDKRDVLGAMATALRGHGTHRGVNQAHAKPWAWHPASLGASNSRHFAWSGNGFAAFELAVRKSSPRSCAIVAASWLCVVSTSARTPRAGVSGPSTANQMNSAEGTSL